MNQWNSGQKGFEVIDESGGEAGLFSKIANNLMTILLLLLLAVAGVFYYIYKNYLVEDEAEPTIHEIPPLVRTVAANPPQKIAVTPAESDQERIKALMLEHLGEVEYRLRPYQPENAAAMKRRYPRLAAQGEVFTKIGGQYHYLSTDGQRLYRCIPKRGAAKSNNGSVIVYSPSSLSGEQPALQGDNTPKPGDIYRDKDGTWKNF